MYWGYRGSAFRGSGVQRFKVPRFRGSGVQGFRGSGLQGSEVQRFRGSRFRGSRGSRFRGSEVQGSELQGSEVQGSRLDFKRFQVFRRRRIRCQRTEVRGQSAEKDRGYLLLVIGFAVRFQPCLWPGRHPVIWKLTAPAIQPFFWTLEILILGFIWNLVLDIWNFNS